MSDGDRVAERLVRLEQEHEALKREFRSHMRYSAVLGGVVGLLLSAWLLPHVLSKRPPHEIEFGTPEKAEARMSAVSGTSGVQLWSVKDAGTAWLRADGTGSYLSMAHPYESAETELAVAYDTPKITMSSPQGSAELGVFKDGPALILRDVAGKVVYRTPPVHE